MINVGRLGAFVLLATAIAAASIAVSFRVSFPTDPLGPRVFPFVASALLAVGAVALLKEDAGAPSEQVPGYRRIAWAVVAFLAYALLLSPLGFVIATASVFTGLAVLFGGSFQKSAVAGVCSALALYAVFVYGLGLPLPLGFLADALLT